MHWLAAVGASTALAAPKAKGKTPAAGSGSGSAAAGDGGEIEMGDDAGAKAKGGAKPAAGGSAAAAPGADGEIEMGDDAGSAAPGDLAADIAATDAKDNATKVGDDQIKKTPVSWRDILVVIRKPFLKVHRVELNPFVATTMNDNIIRHYSEGGELAYYLTDVLAIGVEGQYYEHVFQEPFDLVARQARRLPTVNQYNWSTALDFHYVPVYGKFAVLDHRLITWEAYFTAGIGAGQSEVIPRDTKFPGFTNFLIEPNVGAGMRFFLAKWLTINFGIRDYAFEDHFEPTDRELPSMAHPMGVNLTSAEASANADGAFINNIVFQIGLAFWVPTSFEYTTFR